MILEFDVLTAHKTVERRKLVVRCRDKKHRRGVCDADLCRPAIFQAHKKAQPVLAARIVGGGRDQNTGQVCAQDGVSPRKGKRA